MTVTEKADMYRGLRVLCEQYGFITDHTLELLDAVVDSVLDAEASSLFELSPERKTK